MNSIERLQSDLSARLPRLRFEVDAPELEAGFWSMDAWLGGEYRMSINWRERDGFFFSTPRPDDLWSGHDEGARDYDRALARIAHLLEAGGETIPPLPVRLGELRRARGLSQTELAERAGLTQANLSRVESQDDTKLGTLQKIVATMGASLSIVAPFPDGSHWELKV